MSEEQARKLIKEEFMNNVMSNLDSALIFTYIQNLEQRIDKAIEYIENNTYDDSLDGDGSRLMFEKANGKDLLEILKGEEE